MLIGGSRPWLGFARRSSGGSAAAVVTTPSYGARLVAANAEYLSIADASQTGLDFGTGDFSLFGWAYLDAVDSRAICSKKGTATGNDAGWTIRTAPGGELTGRLADGALSVLVTHGTALSADTLYFWCVTFDRDGNMGLSINAGAEATGDISARTLAVDNAMPFLIGKVSNGGTGYPDAGFSCFGAANAILDATDRTALYNAGSPLLWAGVGATQAAKIVSYWNLDEQSDGSGAVTRNDSKGANHLTDNNTTPSSAFPFTG